MDSNFVAINLIEDKDITLFPYPIVYYWDGSSKIEDALKEKQFLDYISSKISIENFNKIKITMVYIYFDEDGESHYNNQEFNLQDIYELNIFDLENKYLWSVLNFLYKCAYKKDYENVYKYKEIFNALQSKYPKKITPIVVSNFIKSHLSEKYPEMKETNVNLIIEKFYNEIA